MQTTVMSGPDNVDCRGRWRGLPAGRPPGSGAASPCPPTTFYLLRFPPNPTSKPPAGVRSRNSPTADRPTAILGRPITPRRRGPSLETRTLAAPPASRPIRHVELDAARLDCPDPLG